MPARPWEYESYPERKQRELAEFDTFANSTLEAVVDPDPMRAESVKQAVKARQTRDADQEARSATRMDIGERVRQQMQTTAPRDEGTETGSIADRVRARMEGGTPSQEGGGGGLLSRVGDFIEEADKPLSQRLGVEIPDLPGPLDEAGNFLLEEVTRPSTLLVAAGGAGLAARSGAIASRLAARSAATTGVRSAALRGGALAARGAGAVLSPVVGGGLRQRVAGEAAVGVGARLAGEQAADLVPEDAPGVVKVGAGLLGGLAGGAAGARVAGGVLRGSGIDAAIPGRTALRADAPEAIAPTAQNRLGELFGLREVPAELSDRDRVMNIMRETVTGGVPVDERVTPFMRERSRLLNSGGVLDSYASSVSSVADIVARSAFDFDGVGIPALKGIDPDLGDVAPTLADVAARLPLYAERLSPEQMTALREVEAELRPLYEAMVEQGIELHSRGDIMEQGFYIPRGRTDLPGEESIRAGGGGGGLGGRKMGAERSATFESQAAGLEAGYEYATPGEAIKDYIRGASERALDEHTKNYLKSMDEAWTSADDPALQEWRAQMNTLRASLSQKTRTLRDQVNRLTQQQAEGRRTAQAADDVARRAERVGEHTVRGAAKAGEIASDASKSVARETLVVADEAERFGRLSLTAETRALMQKADIEQFEVLAPELVRSDFPTLSTLESRAARLRTEIKLQSGGTPLRTKANMAKVAQLGEVEALAEIRRAADVTDDYGEFLDLIEAAAERSGRYTSERMYTQRGTRRGVGAAKDLPSSMKSGPTQFDRNRAMAPGFGTAERVEWEADRTGRSHASAGDSPTPKPFEAPDDAIRRYEELLTDVVEQKGEIEVSRQRSPEDIIKATEREMRIYDRLRTRFEGLSGKSVDRMMAADDRLGAGAREVGRQGEIAQRITDQGVTQAGRRAEAATVRAEGTGARVDSTVSEIERIRTRLDELIPDYERVKRLAEQTPRGMARVNSSNLTGLEAYAFPERIAAAVNTELAKTKPLTGRGASVQNTLNAVNRLMRMLNATMDVSFMGIQGLLGAVTDPDGYRQAMETAYASMRDPQALGAYLRTKDPEILKQMVRDGVRVGGSNMEFTTSGMTSGRGVLANVAQYLEDADWARGLNPVRGANRSFSTFGDVMRIELYESLTEVARASGLDVADDAVRAAIANSANLMTGTGARAFLGDDIGGLVTFAPRYFQAQLDLVGKALTDGGLEGALGRRTLTRLIGAAAGLTVAANGLLGEETDFDPNSSNFMRIRVAGQDISLLGPWDSLMRGAMNTASGDPLSLARSKASPVVRTAWDLMSGEDYIGDDTRTPEYVATMFLPFSLQDAASDSPVTTAIGLTGLKASPQSPTDRLDALASMEYGESFYDLEPQYQQAIREAHPDLWAEAVERRDGPGARSAELKLDLRAQQDADDQLLASGQLTREDWRTERGRRLDEHRIVMRELYGDERPSDEEAADDPFARYAQVIHDAEDQATGRVDWDAVEVARAQDFTDEENRYIDENTGVWSSPLSQAYRSITREYYALPQYRGYTADEAREINAAWTQVNNRANEIAGQYGREADRRMRAAAYAELKDSLGVDENILVGVRRRIMGMLQEASDRKEFREERPEVGIFLGSGPLTQTEQRIVSRLAGAPDGGSAAPSSIADRVRERMAAAR